MTQPRVVNVSFNQTTCRYPDWLRINIKFDQPVRGFKFKNLIFETFDDPNVNITGVNSAPNAPAPAQGIYFGQTLVSETYTWQSAPDTCTFTFQVSPFAKGKFRLSNQIWNKPLSIEAYNVANQPADFSAFLAPGVFEGIEATPYFNTFFRSGSISSSATNFGTPSLKQQWSCLKDENPNRYTDFQVRMAPGVNPPSEPYRMPNWAQGNFWWWEASGCNPGCGVRPTDVPDKNWRYYFSNDPATTSGPRWYLLGGIGGLGVENSFMPVNGPTWDPIDAVNQWGSKLAINENRGTWPKYYWPCPLFGTDPITPCNGVNHAIGRWEGWLLANPAKGDPLKDMPPGWTGQQSSSVDNNCLSPWRLAKDSDPVPILVQVYFQQNWTFFTDNLVNF